MLIVHFSLKNIIILERGSYLGVLVKFEIPDKLKYWTELSVLYIIAKFVLHGRVNSSNTNDATFFEGFGMLSKEAHYHSNSLNSSFTLIWR